MRGRSPACSVCKSLGHRIEKCPHPAAKRDPQAAQRKFCLEETIEEKGFETRKKMAKGSQVGQGIPKESFCLIQRQACCKIAFTSGDSSKTEACLGCVFDLPTTENTAASWLLDRQWIRSPTVCSECDRHVFSDLVWSQDRPPHWRCKHCGVRVKIYDLSIFTGLRVSPCELVKLIGLYVSSNLDHYPSVPDFVQVQREIENIVFHCEVFFFTITSLIIARASTHGRSCVEHFLAALRMLESTAGKNFSQTCPLRGSVEVDGSFIANFTCLLTICGMQTKFRRLTSLVNVKVNDFRNRLLAILWFWEHRCEETRQLRYMCLDPMCLGCKGSSSADMFNIF